MRNIWSRIERAVKSLLEKIGLRGSDDNGNGNGGGGSGGGNNDNIPFNLNEVTWLHSNVSNWPITSKLNSVSISGGLIHMPYDKANVWEGRNHVGAFVNANPWIFVNQNGKWYGATWEWMRRGQTSKNVRAVNGDHIKRNPLNNFVPRSGETYGFMVSGLARDNVRNVQERTNIVMFKWP